MNDQTTALAQRPSGQVQTQKEEVDFQPFGAADRIKLNVSIVQSLCAVPTRSGQLPTRQDALRFMMLCRAQRLNPFAGDAYLVGYDTKNGPKFNLITAHQAFLKRAEVNPEFDGMASGVIVAPGLDCVACNGTGLVSYSGKPVVCPICSGKGKRDEVEGDLVPEGQELVGGWAHVKLRNRSIPTHRRISLAAGRPEFASPIWEKNPAGMIVKQAEADALRSTFPTLLGGLLMQGETPIDLIGDRAESSREVVALSNPAPVQKRSAAPAVQQLPTPPAPPTQQPAQARRGPTPVEEPLSAEERAEAEMGIAPQAPQAEAATVETPTAPTKPAAIPLQEQLCDIVVGAGFNYDTFAAWGRAEFGSGDKSTGILAWDTWSGFVDVSDQFAKFCIRAKTGMLAALKGGGL